MYRHILIATGGAAHSQRAEARAIGLAAALGARLSVLSVMRLSEMTQGLGLAGEATSVPSDLLEGLRGRHEAILAEARARARAQGLEPELVLESGSASRSIVGVAVERDCDLIVVGRRPLSALGRAAVGSVSDYVNHQAACDVLIVR
ncbi:MAG TPA: universal stress protein [Trueperaceae bacterium]